MKINKDPIIRLFSYKAKVKRGKVIKKTIAAETKSEAIATIKKMGYQLISIKDKTPFIIRTEEVPKKELVSFLFKFATYIDSSMPPIAVLNTVLNEDFSYQTKLFFGDLKQSFKDGLPAHIAFKKTGLIDNQTAQLIQIGESTGTLSKSLIEIATLIDKKVKMKEDLKKSTLKPAFTVLFAINIVVFVVPTMIEPIKSIFTSIGKGEIPPLTQFMLNMTDYMKTNGHFVLIGVALFLISIIWLYTTNKGAKKLIDKMLIKMPIIGSFVQSSYIFLFFVTLNMFVQSGFSVVQALSEITKSISNEEIKEDINAVSIEVKNGKPLSQAILQSVYIPDMFKETFISGEKTGSLKEDLLEVINLSNKNFEEESKKVVTKITGAISAMVMGIVGVVVFAVYMPMFSLIGTINQTLAEG